MIRTENTNQVGLCSTLKVMILIWGKKSKLESQVALFDRLSRVSVQLITHSDQNLNERNQCIFIIHLKLQFNRE